jgi:hypothetical protein
LHECQTLKSKLQKIDRFPGLPISPSLQAKFGCPSWFWFRLNWVHEPRKGASSFGPMSRRRPNGPGVAGPSASLPVGPQTAGLRGARAVPQAGGGRARSHGSPESKARSTPSHQVQVERLQEIGTAPQSARKQHGGVGRADHMAEDPRNLLNRRTALASDVSNQGQIDASVGPRRTQTNQSRSIRGLSGVLPCC